MATLKIDLIVDDKGTVTVNKMKQDLGALDQVIRKTDTAVSGIGSNLLKLAGAFGIGFGISQITNAAKEYAVLGAKAMQAEEAFRNTAASVGVNASAWEEALKKATASTVDSSDLMQKAMKAVTGGMKWEDTIKLGDVARIAARRTGEDVGEAYNNISDAVETMRARALRAYGLITKDQAKWIEQIKSTGQELDIMSVIMTNYAAQTEIMGKADDNAAESFQRAKAAIQDFKEAIGKGLIEEIGNLVMALKGLINVGREIGKEGFFTWWGRKKDETANMLNMSNAGYMPGPYNEGTAVASDEARRKQEEMNKKLKAMSQQGSYDFITNAIRNLKQEVDALNPSLTEEDKTLKKITDKIEDLNQQALQKHISLTGQQTKALEALKNQTIEYIRIQGVLKAQYNDIGEFEFHSGMIHDQPFTPEDIAIEAEYIKTMATYMDDFDTATRNAQNDLETFLEQEGFTIKTIEDLLKQSFDAMGDAFGDFCANGTFDFAKMAQSIIKDITMIAYKMAIFGNAQGTADISKGVYGWAASGLSSLFLGGSAAGASMGFGDWTLGLGFHKGGTVGSDSPTFANVYPASMFSNAPRLHSGLNSDEFPAILQGGEKVIPKGGAKSGGGSPTFIVHMENPVFQDMDTQRQVMSQIATVIAKRVAPGAVVENYQNDGAIRSMVRERK
jgi:lambda family phage tail tape measure protein